VKQETDRINSSYFSNGLFKKQQDFSFMICHPFADVIHRDWWKMVATDFMLAFFRHQSKPFHGANFVVLSSFCLFVVVPLTPLALTLPLAAAAVTMMTTRKHPQPDCYRLPPPKMCSIRSPPCWWNLASWKKKTRASSAKPLRLRWWRLNGIRSPRRAD